MPDPTTEDRRAAASTGFFGHVAGFFAGLTQYLKARLELAGLEAKEAAVHYAIILALFIAALVVMVFGYFFLCIALIFGIAALVPGPYTWIWLTFGMALLHFGGAIVALLFARTRITAPMFSATLEELKKDHEWLSSKTARQP